MSISPFGGGVIQFFHLWQSLRLKVGFSLFLYVLAILPRDEKERGVSSQFQRGNISAPGGTDLNQEGSALSFVHL